VSCCRAAWRVFGLCVACWACRVARVLWRVARVACLCAACWVCWLSVCSSFLDVIAFRVFSMLRVGRVGDFRVPCSACRVARAWLGGRVRSQRQHVRSGVPWHVRKPRVACCVACPAIPASVVAVTSFFVNVCGVPPHTSRFNRLPPFDAISVTSPALLACLLACVLACLLACRSSHPRRGPRKLPTGKVVAAVVVDACCGTVFFWT
jgi:hypothetical protein